MSLVPDLNSFRLRSLPVPPVAIPERLSSSLLPPSFAPGRFAVFFLPAGADLVRAGFAGG